MKTKSFQAYLEQRLSKEEIEEIKRHADLEVRILRYKQCNKISFNKFIKNLNCPPGIAKLQQ